MPLQCSYIAFALFASNNLIDEQRQMMFISKSMLASKQLIRLHKVPLVQIKQMNLGFRLFGNQPMAVYYINFSFGIIVFFVNRAEAPVLQHISI